MKEDAGNVLGKACEKDRPSLSRANLFTLNFQAFGGSHENSQVVTIIFFLNQNRGLYGKER